MSERVFSYFGDLGYLIQTVASDEPELLLARYFYHDVSASGQPQRKQSSVVRTNCMDWCVSPFVLSFLSIPPSH